MSCLDEEQGDCLAVQVGAVLEEIGGQFLFEFKISNLWKCCVFAGICYPDTTCGSPISVYWTNNNSQDYK